MQFWIEVFMINIKMTILNVLSGSSTILQIHCRLEMFIIEWINSSPVPSLGWSILYWGVEYKSRQTGPFSVTANSKEVPFEVGTACRSFLNK